jgi:FixJ family two-component response regulator
MHPFMSGVSKDIIYVAVVDDDESVCRSFSRLVRAAGFQPVTYASAEALLEDTKRPRFDCLLLDIQLGGMSGLELSRRLAAVRDFTPVIFITAHDDKKERLKERLKELGPSCVGYFSKTDPAEMILEAIRRAVGIARPRTAEAAPDRPKNSVN